MAKATYLICDICETQDSEDTPVRATTVVTSRLDLCAEDRVVVLTAAGLAKEDAQAAVAAHNDIVTRAPRGAK